MGDSRKLDFNLTFGSSVSRLGDGNKRITRPASRVAHKHNLLTELILESNLVQAAVMSSSSAAPIRTARDNPAFGMILNKYKEVAERNAYDLNDLHQRVGEDTSLPTMEQTQFDTGPQRLLVNLNRLVNEFGENSEPVAVQRRTGAELVMVDNLLEITTNMVRLTF